MGNRQSNKKENRSDDDTPEETKTKCCEIPQKKFKDRVGKSSRSNRTDDVTFESEVVDSVENRTRSEYELHDSVELEPFEIIETDDIKFIAGAGTSEVIKCASESKFKTIPEEAIIEDNELVRDVEETGAKRTFTIQKGNRILEAGTATAHSTFEFKQVKTKLKKNDAVNKNNIQYEEAHTYEIVSSQSENNFENNGKRLAALNSTTSYNFKEESSCSSKESSKEAIQKPSRKAKGNKTEKIRDPPSNEEKRKVIHLNGPPLRDCEIVIQLDSPPLRDSEIDRNIDCVFLLTQTMFSQTKPDVQKADMQNEESQQAICPTTYENINVCAKLVPTGILIGHKTSPKRLVVQEARKATKISRNTHSSNNVLSELKPFDETSNNNALIVESVTEILPDSKICDNSYDLALENYEDVTNFLHSKEAINRTEVYLTDAKCTESKIQPLKENKSTLAKFPRNEMNNNKTYEYTTSTSKDDADKVFNHPPSPLSMNVFKEVDEDEFSGDGNYYTEEKKRRITEIVEFTDTVCKRLSKLLEDSAQDDNNIQVDNTVQKDIAVYDTENHFYETLNKAFRHAHTSSKETSKHVAENVNNEDKIALVANNYDCDRELTNTRSGSSSAFKTISDDSNLCTFAKKLLDSSEKFNLPDNFNRQDSRESQQFGTSLCSEYCIKANRNIIDSTVDQMQHDGDEIVKGKFTGKRAIPFSLQTFKSRLLRDAHVINKTEDIADVMPADARSKISPNLELVKAEDQILTQNDPLERHSITCTESDIDNSEHQDDLSTDSMLADDEEDMEILFAKTYQEPVVGAEVFLSCTVVKSANKDEMKRRETWLSDEALKYLEANASEIMSTAFLKAKKEMKDIQICLQSLRKQMEHFRGDWDDISLPDIHVESLSLDYFGHPRKAITD